jgi:glycerophosphoryl diester phosphodiesterase
MFAFNYAALQGADGVERTHVSTYCFLICLKFNTTGLPVDTRLSADGVPIVMHDANAVRLMYGDGCEAPLESMSVAQIRQLTWKKVAPAANCPRPLPKGFVAAPRLSTAEQKLFDAPVPTLEEVIVFCKEHELKLMIESKEWFRPRQMAKAIAKLFAKHQCYSNMFVASFNPIVLYWIRRENINIETMMLFTNNLLQKQASSGAELFPWWVEAVAPFVDPILSYSAQHVLPDFLGCGLIGAHNLLVCKDMIDSYRQRGIVTDIWVSNEVNELRWLHKQNTMVTTDFLFKEYLDTRRAALKDEESKRDQ